MTRILIPDATDVPVLDALAPAFLDLVIDPQGSVAQHARDLQERARALRLIRTEQPTLLAPYRDEVRDALAQAGLRGERLEVALTALLASTGVARIIARRVSRIDRTGRSHEASGPQCRRTDRTPYRLCNRDHHRKRYRSRYRSRYRYWDRR